MMINTVNKYQNIKKKTSLTLNSNHSLKHRLHQEIVLVRNYSLLRRRCSGKEPNVETLP